MKTASIIKCPNCGGQLSVSSGEVKCPFCNETLLIDDNSTRIIKRINRYEISNEAQIAKWNYKLYKTGRGLNSTQQYAIYVVITAVIALILFIIPTVHHKLTKTQIERHIEAAEEQNLICAGNYWDYIGDHHKEVTQRFKDMGFVNVKEKALHDTVQFWIWGDVVTVSINGRSNFEYSDYFKPDAKVLITFH